MKPVLTSLALIASLPIAAIAGTAMQPVKTHPSQGEPAIVDGAEARMAMDDDGLFVSLKTDGLTPGNVHTLWLVVINDPVACETSPCTSKDVLKRSDIVSSDVGYAGGVIVDDEGYAEFAWHQEEGDLTGGWFGNGLQNLHSAEVHLVVNDHGPLLPGREAAMLSTYRDGCTDESIPAPMPATARAQGEPGPNTCRLMQFAIFSDVAPES